MGKKEVMQANYITSDATEQQIVKTIKEIFKMQEQINDSTKVKRLDQKALRYNNFALRDDFEFFTLRISVGV